MFLKTVIFAIFISGCVSISLKYLDENKDSRHRENVEHVRRKRYLGLSRRFKLNRRYQECVSLGDAQGHCKHIDFCPLNVLGTAKNVISYLCVIERAYVGVCCPDDFAAAGYGGSQLIMDLPGGAYDYESSNDTTSGCGVPIDGRVTIKDMPTSKQTTVQEWPWIAALYKPMELMKNLQQFCSGTVITDRHILTAAHCTHGIKAADIGVRLGEYNFGVINETRHTDHVVAEIIEHSDYVPGKFENDIAILRLEKPTAFNSYVWPICLPPVEGSYENKMAVVAGWGQQYYNGPLSPVLMQVAIPIWPHQQCVDAFIETIFDSNLCAAGYDGGKDSCSGDSGGPLNYQLENGRWVVIGVVSWGIGCAQKGRPGVYTRVDHYLPWIIKNTIAQ